MHMQKQYLMEETILLLHGGVRPISVAEDRRSSRGIPAWRRQAFQIGGLVFTFLRDSDSVFNSSCILLFICDFAAILKLGKAQVIMFLSERKKRAKRGPASQTCIVKVSTLCS